MSKNVSANMPPEPTRLVQAERMRVVLMEGEDMVMSSVSVGNVSSEDVRWSIVCRNTKGTVEYLCCFYGCYAISSWAKTDWLNPSVIVSLLQCELS